MNVIEIKSADQICNNEKLLLITATQQQQSQQNFKKSKRDTVLFVVYVR